MRVSDVQAPMLLTDYDNQVMPYYEDTTRTGGGSNVVEPEIIMPTYIQNNTPVRGDSVNLEQASVLTQQGVGNSQVLTNTLAKPNTDAESSPTTDETKTYVSGGTTPNSSIVVDKPKRNYLIYGIIGSVGVYVAYKLFFNKKIE